MEKLDIYMWRLGVIGSSLLEIKICEGLVSFDVYYC